MSKVGRQLRFYLLSLFTIHILLVMSSEGNQVAFRDVSEMLINSNNAVSVELPTYVAENPKKVLVAKVTTRGDVIRITPREKSILVRIVEAEATEGTLRQKMNVAQVVLNRLHDERFPNTIEGVVFEKLQFSPTEDGRYESVSITEESVVAVEMVLANPTLHDALFFKTYDCHSSWFGTLKYLFKDGIHKYYN